MSFIHDDFMLQSETAKKLYHEYAENMPIFDYHCHLVPQQIAEDYEFEIKLNKVKVDEINTDDDYKELSDNFNKILKDKSNLEKIAKYIISDKEIEEFIEKTYFKEKERERDDY